MPDQFENKIKDGLFSLAPDSFDEIMARGPVQLETEEELLGEFAENSTKKRRRFRSVWFLAGAAAVLFLCVFSWTFLQQNRVVDTLYIDVNPSICIGLNQAGQVKRITGDNPEGQEVIDRAKEELKDAASPGAVFTILLDGLEKGGYFKDHEMDMLLSLSYSDDRRIVLLDELSKIAEAYAKEKEFDELLLVQSFPKEEADTKEASEEGISVGKHHLLKTLEQENRITLKTYQSRSIRELNEYIKSKHLMFGEDKSGGKSDSGFREEHRSFRNNTSSKTKDEEASGSKKTTTNKVNGKTSEKKKKSKKKKQNNSSGQAADQGNDSAETNKKQNKQSSQNTPSGSGQKNSSSGNSGSNNSGNFGSKEAGRNAENSGSKEKSRNSGNAGQNGNKQNQGNSGTKEKSSEKPKKQNSQKGNNSSSSDKKTKEKNNSKGSEKGKKNQDGN